MAGLAKGMRVELHPATDDWMRGDRFGTVTGFGRIKLRHDPKTGRLLGFYPIYVTLDRSGRRKRFHPANVVPIQ